MNHSCCAGLHGIDIPSSVMRAYVNAIEQRFGPVRK
jgi:hypothetical protein